MHENCVKKHICAYAKVLLTDCASVENLAEMAAVGLGLPRETFKDAGRYGYVSDATWLLFQANYGRLCYRPHLLAPTASDLVKYGEKDTILAGFHTDLNFLTIHGRSRYPGLNIWARNTGKRIAVRFPPTGRYLLVQAGKQLEHLSGGLIKAGFHEVVVNEATLGVSVLYRASYVLYFVDTSTRRLNDGSPRIPIVL